MAAEVEGGAYRERPVWAEYRDDRASQRQTEQLRAGGGDIVQ